MKIYRAIGLMSGTSMDGIDVAMIETDGETHIKRIGFWFFPYSNHYRDLLRQALEDAQLITRRTDRPGILAKVEKMLDSKHEDILIFDVSIELGVSGSEMADVIGYHGQTVLHRPNLGLTVQLGNGQHIADATEIPVVYDMRANDMLHGGQGAPLVPIYHQALAASLVDVGEVAFVNIGGISNVTFVGPGHNPVAFDSGPGNALIDQWVQAKAGIPFDDNGQIASEGVADETIVEHVMALPFFAKGPPKSLDRNDFSPALVNDLELADGARTLAAISARAIFAAADHAPRPPKTWIICGGGRKNRILVNHLAELAEKKNQRVLLAEEAGFNGDSMEAEAWAYLAVRSLRGLPLTFPETTGVREPVTGGILCRPKQ